MKLFRLVIFVIVIAMAASIAFAEGDIVRYRLGNYEFISLNDRVGAVRDSNAKLADEAKLAAYMKIAGWADNALNYFVLDTGKQKILFDAGNPGGNTTKMLEKAGIKPDDIDIIMITHMHGDHIGGLLDGSGKAVFPKAKMYIGKEEAAYWATTTNEMAKNVLSVYKANINTFSQKQTIEGIESIPTFGHTPGHTAFKVTSDGESAVIWGDITHARIQFADPDVYMTYDVDPVMAVKTRKALMAELADSGTYIAGMHIFAPGFGSLEKKGTGYTFELE